MNALFTTYPVLYSLLAGVLISVIIFYLLRYAVKYYLNSYINYFAAELGKLFIPVSYKVILLCHIILLLLMSVVGYVAAGFIGTIGALFIAFFMPILQLRRMKKRHVTLFITQLPDVMNSISAMLKAGTHLSKALHLITEQQSSPVSNELMLVLSEYKMGRSLNIALNGMADRINRQEVQLLITAIAISNQVGGNLAVTLDTLSDTLREKITIEGKIDALTSMGRMQAKVVSFIPVAVICVLYMQEPQAMLSLFYDPLGWLILLVLGVLMSFALLIIKRITAISV